MSDTNWYTDVLATLKRQAEAQERIAAVLEGIISARAAKNAAASEADEQFKELLRQRLPGYKG